jgi:hypothetical protein
MSKFRKGQSGNPGGRPKVLAEIQELARRHTSDAIAELARLSLKAKSERTRIAAIRELLDRAYGRSRQSLEIDTNPSDPMQALLDYIDEVGRRGANSGAKTPIEVGDDLGLAAAHGTSSM